MVWHPMLSAVEVTPGHWHMLDQYERVYGDVQLVKRGGEVGYRGLDEGGKVVGYYTTFRAATKGVHEAFLRSRTPAASKEYAAQKHE